MSAPATPVRNNRPASHSYAHSVSQSHFRSPLTPASPYTPLSLRSFASSNPSSTLTTPGSVKYQPHTTSLSFSSPQVTKSLITSPNIFSEKSVADVAQNWRSRATENGIKVSGVIENFDYQDYSCSEADESGFITTEEALLPPPFFSTQRRRSLSQSQAGGFPNNNMTRSPLQRRPPPTSPLMRRTLNSVQNSIMATPPSNRALAKQIKMKGSRTDPAHTRRREAFGVIPQASQNITTPNGNHSLNLFDIRENEYEHEYTEDEIDYIEYHLSMRKQDDPHECMPYPILNAGPTASIPFYGQPTLNDPFGGISSGMHAAFAESLDMQFQQYQRQLAYSNSDLSQVPSHPPQPDAASLQTNTGRPVTTVYPPPNIPLPHVPPASCSVCSREKPTRLAILSPCGHPLCSACLTSALNIVGEKDMECAVCKQAVDDFKLVASEPIVPLSFEDTCDTKNPLRSVFNGIENQVPDEEVCRGRSFMDPLFSSPGSAVSGSNRSGLESAFDLSGPFGFEEDEGFRSSTPPNQYRNFEEFRLQDNVVLRVDNVPWDITPPAISYWLQQPIVKSHVLLDKKGKTLSHAFVEVETKEIASAILRGETSRGSLAVTRNGRGTVLGQGRRARGVTVTRSSQEELMIALFPSWHGAFDGSRPSLNGLSNNRVINTLEGGIMSEAELASLSFLIRSPDAHFLKVPSLPFHYLISIVSKFPADVDSRVFWSPALRDALYNIAYNALEILLIRIEKGDGSDKPAEYTMDMARGLVDCIVNSPSFTSVQSTNIANLLPRPEEDSESSIASSCPDADIEDGGEEIEEGNNRTPSSTAVSTTSSPSLDSNPTAEQEQPTSQSSLGDLAKEFGLDTELIQALAERLANANIR